MTPLTDWSKRTVARLPGRWQHELRRRHFRRQIRAGTFVPDEPEIRALPKLVSRGDRVVDIGANVGHYTIPLARAVGPAGRVFALEPLAATFAILSSNLHDAGVENVTLVNAAASKEFDEMGLTVPLFATGLANFYMAHLTPRSGTFGVYCVPVDTLLPRDHPIALIKIDAEGHDLEALQGMSATLRAGTPTLIVENHTDEVADHLVDFGYDRRRLPGSPSRIFFAGEPPDIW